MMILAPTIVRAPLPDVTTRYLETVRLVEVLRHRLHLSIKGHLDQMDAGLTTSQAMMLYRIGDEEVRPSDLRKFGYYLNENPSWNLKKLVEAGLINKRQSETDHRVVWLTLTDKGHDIADAVRMLLERQARLVSPTGLSALDLTDMNTSLNRIVTVLGHQVAYRL